MKSRPRYRDSAKRSRCRFRANTGVLISDCASPVRHLWQPCPAILRACPAILKGWMLFRSGGTPGVTLFRVPIFSLEFPSNYGDRIEPWHTLRRHSFAGGFEGSAPKPAPPSDHIPLRRRCALGMRNRLLVRFCTLLRGTKFRLPRDVLGRATQSESVMAGLYLGIAVAGINALIATGLVIALM